MAKKTENKPKEQAAVPEKQEPAAEAQDAVLEKQEPAAEAQEAALEKQEPEQAAAVSVAKLEEILNDDIEPAEEELPREDDDQRDTELPDEKILFYVKTVNVKTAIRSTPEYPMSGAGNATSIITDRGPYGIVETVNGFGRIAGGAGWIMLDPSVVIRQ